MIFFKKLWCPSLKLDSIYPFFVVMHGKRVKATYKVALKFGTLSQTMWVITLSSCNHRNLLCNWILNPILNSSNGQIRRSHKIILQKEMNFQEVVNYVTFFGIYTIYKDVQGHWASFGRNIEIINHHEDNHEHPYLVRIFIDVSADGGFFEVFFLRVQIRLFFSMKSGS